MDSCVHPKERKSHLIASCLLALILLSIYSNSFHADWQMDDRANIVDNQALHIQDLKPQSLWLTFFANQGGAAKLYRPLPCLSFSLNWYFGGHNPFGYHVVNLGFHYATALALYFLILRLLPIVNNSSETDHHQSIALMAATLWAINPVQTQAVTYIIQRMAVMAAFFYVLGVLYFVKARTAQNFRSQLVNATICAIFFLCALGSKENAVMLPFTLVLVEWLFFKKGRTDFLRSPVFWITAGILCVAAFAIAHVLTDGFSFLTSGYKHRPFTMTERLLTQPRIVLGYISQIFLPMPGRLSIAHDISFSRSLIDPWNTLPAIFLILVMIAGAFAFAPRYPLAAFAILFFFLNHATESSILPLELVFEHRNYLPSIFLFLPVAAGIHQILLRLQKHRPIYLFAVASTAVMLISLGLGTYTRNSAWATEITLWTDAAYKAPKSIRPLVSLGIELGWRENPSPSDYRHALVLFKSALELPPVTRSSEHSEIMGNIAGIYFRQEKYEQAISTYYKALEMDSDFLKNRYDLIKPLVVTGNFSEAEHHAQYLVDRQGSNSRYLSLLGFILLWQNKPDDAVHYLQKALSNGHESSSLYINTGVALTRIGKMEKGLWFLKLAGEKSPGDLFPLLALIENRDAAGNANGANFYARQLISRFSVVSIADRISNLDNDFRSAPISRERIVPYINEALYMNLNRMIPEGT